MIRIQLRSVGAIDRAKEAYGYGRVYHSLMPLLLQRDDVRMVDSARAADIQVCHTAPARDSQRFHWWGRRRHPVQVIYTVWEESELPLGWIETLLEMKAVFTASQWCVNLFRRSLQNRIPVHLVHHGVSADSFEYLERDWNATPFIFIWQGMHQADRKGAIYARKAFTELNLPEAWLIEKWYPKCSRPWGPYAYHRERRMEIGQFLLKADYLKLLQRCHVSLCCSRGEGFGMMPLEVGLTGMPSVVTNWSGFTDYINPQCFRPLKYRLSEPGQDFISTSPFVKKMRMPPAAQDAIPDIDDLKEAMKFFYENRQAAAAMGQRAHEYVKTNWGWERCTEQFVQACKQVLDGAV